MPDRPRVLIVEDDFLQALSLADALRDAGFAPCGPADGASGVAAAHRIRAEQSAPVVFLTASSDAAQREAMVALAPAAVLTKPCDPQDLCRAVAAALGPAGLAPAA